jgi:hypothetical protein
VNPTCSVCGTVADDDEVPLGWSTGVERGRPVVVCADCTRTHARSIEAKLDSEWW